MPIDKDISIHLSCQQFECNRFDINEARSVLFFRSNRRSDEVACPFCGGRVHVYDSACTTLKDMPLWFGVPLELEVEHHRYRCTCCGGSQGPQGEGRCAEGGCSMRILFGRQEGPQVRSKGGEPPVLHRQGSKMGSPLECPKPLLRECTKPGFDSGGPQRPCALPCDEGGDVQTLRTQGPRRSPAWLDAVVLRCQEDRLRPPKRGLLLHPRKVSLDSIRQRFIPEENVKSQTF